MNNKKEMLAVLLRNSEILMRELEEERDESLENLRYEGEEEILEQYYRKLLSSIYRVRNNTAALLLRSGCTCAEEGDYIVIFVDYVKCYIQKKSLSLILQKDYDRIIKENLTEKPESLFTKESLKKFKDDFHEGGMLLGKPEKTIHGQYSTEEHTYQHDEEIVNGTEQKIEDETTNQIRKEKANEQELIKNNQTKEKPDLQNNNKETSLRKNNKPDEIDNTEKTMQNKKAKEQKEDTSLDLNDDFGFTDDDFFFNEPEEPSSQKDSEKAADVSEPQKDVKNKSLIESNMDDMDFGFDDNDFSFGDETSKTSEETESIPKEDKKEQKQDDDFGFNLDEEFLFDEPENLKSEPVENKEQTSRKDKEENRFNFDSVKESKPVHQEKQTEDDFDFGFGDDSFFEEDKKEVETNTEQHKQKEEDNKQPAENPFDKIKMDDFDDLDFGLFDDEELPAEENKKEEPKNPSDKFKQVLKEPEPIKQEKNEDLDFGFFNEPQTPSKKEENKFNPILDKKPKPEPIKEEKPEAKPNFTTFTDSDDPDEIMKKLKESRKEYDRMKTEQEIENLQKTEISGKVFDLSTGSLRSGELDVQEASEKINKVAGGLIDTSRRDRIMDESLSGDRIEDDATYKIQRYTDYKRKKDQFVLDVYQLIIGVKERNGSIRKEKAKLIVAPMEIPESGTKLSSEICVYMEMDNELHGAVVEPGGKTTVGIKCKDYVIFVKGYWENGHFISNISLRGNGCEVANKNKKEEIRPKSMKNIGIGHNIIYMDHATTIHIIPVNFKNTNYNHTEYMAVVVKDYGIDMDAQCVTPGKEIETVINGEKFRYSISAEWNDQDEFEVKTRMIK